MKRIQDLWCEAVSGPLRRLRALLIAGTIVAQILVVIAAILAARRLGPVHAVAMALLVSCALTLSLVAILLLGRLSAKLNDTRALAMLQGWIAERGWRIRDFFLDGASADASLCLLVAKVLSLRPRRILELGSGQTTKLVWNYCRDEPGAEAVSLEHNAAWSRVLDQYLRPAIPNHVVRVAPLERRTWSGPRGKEVTSEWYGVNDLGDGYDVVLIDGPNGSRNYSRSGIVPQLPKLLAPSFVIIVDDAERYGEIMTLGLIESTLQGAGRKYVRWEANGLKRQVVFATPDRGFLVHS
jgi:predicted O-methyltransferase YrrM